MRTAVVPALPHGPAGRRTITRATTELLAALLAAAALAVLPASSARADVVWLCHPDLSAQVDPCKTPLDTTVIAADGSTTVQTPARPAEDQRPVDCFYVYPTVSNQLGPNATKAKDPEVAAVAKFQASRFSSGCRMFAPVYRQATVAAVVGNGLSPVAEVAYSDVLEAWRQYLAKDNGGRGVILIGHSQGTIMLRGLLHRVIDGDPALRDRLVGAFLLGGNVTTRAGQAAGGDFQHVPVCTEPGEDGCVVAYSTSSTDPEPINFFGNTNTDVLGTAFSLPHGPGYEVACTDPGTLSGLTGPLSLTIPTAPYPPGFISGGIALTANGPTPSAPTTWVDAYQYRGSCRTINGAHVFRYDPVGSSRRLNEFPPAWGTHLVDANLGVRRLTTIAGRQTLTWLDAHTAVASPAPEQRTGTASAVLTAPGAGAVTVRGAGLRTRRATVTAPGPLRLRLVPTAATLRRLRAGRAVTVTARVAYRPAGQPAITRTVRARLRRVG